MYFIVTALHDMLDVLLPVFFWSEEFCLDSSMDNPSTYSEFWIRNM